MKDEGELGALATTPAALITALHEIARAWRRAEGWRPIAFVAYRTATGRTPGAKRNARLQMSIRDDLGLRTAFVEAEDVRGSVLRAYRDELQAAGYTTFTDADSVCGQKELSRRTQAVEIDWMTRTRGAKLPARAPVARRGREARAQDAPARRLRNRTRVGADFWENAKQVLHATKWTLVFLDFATSTPAGRVRVHFSVGARGGVQCAVFGPAAALERVRDCVKLRSRPTESGFCIYGAITPADAVAMARVMSGPSRVSRSRGRHGHKVRK